MEGEEIGSMSAPQLKLMMNSMAANNFGQQQQMSLHPNDFTNFFTQDPSGSSYNNDGGGAKSDQQGFGNSLEDYSAPHAPSLVEYPIGYQGPSGYEADSNSYGTPSYNYGAPSDGYDSPSTGYDSLSNSYGAPSNSYEDPSSSYDVPLTDQSLTPHAGAYNSPSYGGHKSLAFPKAVCYISVLWWLFGRVIRQAKGTRSLW